LKTREGKGREGDKRGRQKGYWVTCVILKGRPDKKILASSKLKEGCMRHHHATTSVYVVTSITPVKYIFFP
jgi:hypothetical protein